MDMTPARITINIFVLTVLGSMIVLAGVIGVNHLYVDYSYINPPLTLSPGRNAGGEDINGFVNVVIGPDGLNATIFINATYQVTIYPSLVNLSNNGNITYNYSIVVNTPTDGPPGSVVFLYMFNASNSTLVFRANLSRTGVYGPYPIDPGETLEFGLLIYYPEGVPLQEFKAGFSIAYTNQNETPPEGLG